MELVYEGSTLEFSAPEQLEHVMLLRNGSNTSALFKVQCTAPRKLRVRPALGFLTPSASVSIQIHLNSQEITSATCKLLVLGRKTEVKSVDTQELKALWKATETQKEPLMLSKTINVQIQSDVSGEDKQVTVYSTPPQSLTPSELSMTQVAEIVLLIMKSQSNQKENSLETAECKQLLAAKKCHPVEWPYWEEYAARMRKLLRERSKRKTESVS